MGILLMQKNESAEKQIWGRKDRGMLPDREVNSPVIFKIRSTLILATSDEI